MEKPNVFALSRVRWSLFVTLTFVRETTPDGTRRKYLFAWLRSISEDVGIHFHRLLWLLRSERGEHGGRLHYHALVGGLPDHALTPFYCMRLMARWESAKPLVKRRAPDGSFREQSAICGHPRVRVYDPSLDGLDYVLPECPGGAGSEGLPLAFTYAGANSYEAGKFGWAETVEFSESLRRLLRRTDKVRFSEGTSARSRGMDRSSCEDRPEWAKGSKRNRSVNDVRQLGSPALPEVAVGQPGWVGTRATGLDQRSTVRSGVVNVAWQEIRPGVFASPH